MEKTQNSVTQIQIVLQSTKNTEDNYVDIAEDVETRFNTSNYKLDTSLPKGKNKKVIGLVEDELDGKIMT